MRPLPVRLAQILPGLWLFGMGEAAIVHAELGNSPWTVFAEGVAEHSPLSIGGATVFLSFAVLLLWIPLRQRPGIGTVLNAILIGIAIDATLPWLPGPGGWLGQAAYVAAGIALVGIGSGFYLTARLGPGPRDGLMTALHRRTGRSLRLLRTLIEGTALVAGAVLGGTVGLGTVAFALLVGPAVQAGVLAVSDIDTRTL